MDFSKRLESMVYDTPVVVNKPEKNKKEVYDKGKKQNQQEMLNQLGLAIKRR